MAHFPTPRLNGTAFRVVMIGASQDNHMSLKVGWSDKIYLIMQTTSDNKQVFEISLENYVVQLLPIEETVSNDDAAAILQDAHAVVVVYDKSQPRDVLDSLNNVWIPRLERDAPGKVFITVLHHEVPRPPDELAAPPDPDFDRLFESLPSSDKTCVEYYPDDDVNTYEAFRPVLFEAAVRGVARS